MLQPNVMYLELQGAACEAGRANVIVLFHAAPDMSINISFSSTMKLPTVPWSRNQNIWQLSAASQTAMTSSAHLSLYLLD